MGYGHLSTKPPKYGPSHNDAAKKLASVFQNSHWAWQVQEARDVEDGELYTTLTVHDGTGVHVIRERSDKFPSSELLTKAMLLWG